jgi:hypothetical protein
MDYSSSESSSKMQDARSLSSLQAQHCLISKSPWHPVSIIMSVATKALYSTAASYFHWMVAIPAVGCVGTVLKAQNSPKEEKGKWMFRHKSLGLLTAMVVAPRLAYRVFSSKAVGFTFHLILVEIQKDKDLLLTS